MFEFTEEYEPLLREVREIAEKVVKPRAERLRRVTNFLWIWQIDFLKKATFRF